MKPVAKVLAPVDLVSDTEGALEYAVSIAKQLGAELAFLYALRVPVYVSPEMTVPGADVPFVTLGEFAHQRAQKELDTILERVCTEQGIVARAEIRVGEPADTILAYIREREIDLVVMGTRGRTGLSHLLFGSVAEKVVRLAPCPVLVIPCQALAAPASTMAKGGEGA